MLYIYIFRRPLTQLIRPLVDASCDDTCHTGSQKFPPRFWQIIQDIGIIIGAVLTVTGTQQAGTDDRAHTNKAMTSFAL